MVGRRCAVTRPSSCTTPKQRVDFHRAPGHPDPDSNRRCEAAPPPGRPSIRRPRQMGILHAEALRDLLRLEHHGYVATSRGGPVHSTRAWHGSASEMRRLNDHKLPQSFTRISSRKPRRTGTFSLAAARALDQAAARARDFDTSDSPHENRFSPEVGLKRRAGGHTLQPGSHDTASERGPARSRLLQRRSG